MTEELKIKEQKQIVARGFVQYSQEIVELASQGFVLDIRNKTSPQFQLGLFVCNMLLLEDEEDANIVVPSQVVDNSIDKTETKPKRTYAKSNKAKEALRSKLPAEALQTITK